MPAAASKQPPAAPPAAGASQVLVPRWWQQAVAAILDRSDATACAEAQPLGHGSTAAQLLVAVIIEVQI